MGEQKLPLVTLQGCADQLMLIRSEEFPLWLSGLRT